jgi:hypothetical protein
LLLAHLLAEGWQCDAFRVRTKHRTKTFEELDYTPNASAVFRALDDTLGKASHLVQRYHPVLDFDTDGCYPASAISRSGRLNPGLKTSGKITGKCRNSEFMVNSNTYHRGEQRTQGASVYEAHMFEVYFEKDQLFDYFGGGHRHDVETVLMFFKDEQPMAVGTSAHGDYEMRSWDSVPKEGDHPKVVYHKHGVRTHALRFAKMPVEVAENRYGRFVLPPLASWLDMVGDGLSNAEMKSRLETSNFGSASFKLRDSRFAREFNDHCPEGFPEF